MTKKDIMCRPYKPILTEMRPNMLGKYLILLFIYKFEVLLRGMLSKNDKLSSLEL